MILSQYERMPDMLNLMAHELANIEELFAGFSDFPIRYHPIRQILEIVRPVRLEGWSDHTLELARKALQGQVCMIYLIGDSGHLHLAAISAASDYPIISSDFVHTSLALASEVYSSGEPLSVTTQFRGKKRSLNHESIPTKCSKSNEQMVAVPFYGHEHPVGVFALITNHLGK